MASKGYTVEGQGSDQLRSKSCRGACSKDTPLLTREEIDQHLKSLPAWTLVEDAKKLQREFVARNFAQAMKFLNAAADVAEAEGHHPDLHLTEYRMVKVVVWTHAVGGLSLHDVILAAKLDAVPVEYSKKWLEQNQHLADLLK